MQKVALVVTGLGFLIAIVAMALGATWWWLPFVLSLGAVIARAFQFGYTQFKLKTAESQQEEEEVVKEQPVTDLRIMIPDGDEAMMMGFTVDKDKFAEQGEFFNVMDFLRRQQLQHLVEEARNLFKDQIAQKIPASKAAENVVEILSLMGKDPMGTARRPPLPPQPAKKVKDKPKVITSRIQGSNVKDHGLY